MCGRFVAASPPDEVARYFGATAVAEEVKAAEPEANFNVAPSTDVFVVHEETGERLVDQFHWGLVPIWAKDLKVGNRMINARAETIAEKNAYKRPFAKRRCIIPADGFYEWTKVPGHKKKQPWFIHRPDDEPIAFAGLWDIWRGPDRKGPEEVRSCTIITGSPNEKMANIHDRMPVMLPPSAWDEWLDPTLHDLDVLQEFLVPAPAELIRIHPVSAEVGNVRNRGAHLTERIALLDPDGTGEGTPPADVFVDPDDQTGPPAT